MAGVLDVPPVLLARQTATRDKLNHLRNQFEIEELVDGRCPHVAVLATGSLGRAESGRRSDLDLFLIDTALEQLYAPVREQADAEDDDSRRGRILESLRTLLERPRRAASLLATRNDSSEQAL